MLFGINFIDCLFNRLHFFYYSSKKALSYLRDSPADPNLPVLREGDLNVKVTFIDGKVRF